MPKSSKFRWPRLRLFSIFKVRLGGALPEYPVVTKKGTLMLNPQIGDTLIRVTPPPEMISKAAVRRGL